MALRRLILAFLFVPFVSTQASAGDYEDGLSIVSNPTQLALRLDEAIGKFEAVVRSDKSNKEAWFNLGLLEALRNDDVKARQAWQAALSADAQFLPARAKLAGLALKPAAAKIAEARKALKRAKALRKSAERGAAEFGVRNAAELLENAEIAKKKAKKAEKKKRLKKLARIKARIEKYVAYAALFDQAAEAKSAALDLLRRARKEHEEAETTLLQIVEIDRFQPQARNILAAAAIEREDWDAAIRHARNVLLGDPENANAYLNLAIAYFKQGLLDQALLVATTALERRPDAAALHNVLGLIHLERDDSRNATASFLSALKQDPMLIDAKLNLGALELAYGDFSAALKRFDEVLKVRPKDSMLVMSRAVALRGLERFDEASKGYEKALALDPKDPSPLYNLCVLHQQYTMQYEPALKACEAYEVRIGRRHEKSKEMKRRIESLRLTIEALAAEAEQDAEMGADEYGGEMPEDVGGDGAP